MAEKIVPKKDREGKKVEPSQLELDVANGILNFQVSESKLTCMHVCNVCLIYTLLLVASSIVAV